MSRSIIATSLASLLFLASVLAAFLMGASLRPAPQPTPQMVPSLRLTAHSVRVPVEPEPAWGDGVGARGVNADFTYQGVLTDLSGVPVAGPVSLEFQVLGDPLAGGPRAVISSSLRPGIAPDSAGRFTASVDLPSVDQMGAHAGFGLRIIDADSAAPIVDDLPINPAPYAWLSEQARRSDFADFAGQADTAQELADDQVHELVLDGAFVHNPGLGQAPRAARVGRMVMLTGTMFSDVDNTNGAVVGTLPVGMRPAQTVVLAVHVAVSSNSSNAALIITSSGQISILSPAYGPGLAFFLNGASFIVE